MRDLRERKRRTLLGFVETGESGGSRLFGLLFTLVSSEVLEPGDVESSGWADVSLAGRVGGCSSIGESGGGGMSVPLVRESR